MNAGLIQKKSIVERLKKAYFYILLRKMPTMKLSVSIDNKIIFAPKPFRQWAIIIKFNRYDWRINSIRFIIMSLKIIFYLCILCCLYFFRNSAFLFINNVFINITAETSRYLFSSLLQVFGTIFIGSIIFISFRIDEIKQRKEMSYTKLKSFTELLEKNTKLFIPDYLDNVFDYHMYETKIKDNAEGLLLKKAIRLRQLCRTEHLVTIMTGIKENDDQTPKIMANRLEELKSNKRGKAFKTWTSSMYSYSQQLRDMIDDFIRNKHISSRHGDLASILLASSLMIVYSLIILACIDSMSAMQNMIFTIVAIINAFQPSFFPSCEKKD